MFTPLALYYIPSTEGKVRQMEKTQNSSHLHSTYYVTSAVLGTLQNELK